MPTVMEGIMSETLPTIAALRSKNCQIAQIDHSKTGGSPTFVITPSQKYISEK
jgi:hypothetical protein